MNRWRSVVAAAVICSAVVTGTAEATQATRASRSAAGTAVSGHTCLPSGAHTRARNARGRVYALRGGLFACALATGRSFRLGGLTNCLNDDLVGPAVLAGGMVAFASERCGIDAGQTRVLVRRLSNGRVVHTGDALRDPGVESHTRVETLVARTDGAVAWIAVSDSIAHRSGVEVARIDSRGESVLDTSPQVVAGSLRLVGSRLSWRRGGAMHFASLR